MLNRFYNIKNTTIKLVTDVSSALDENFKFIVANTFIGGVSGFTSGVYFALMSEDGPSDSEKTEMRYAALKNITSTYNCTVLEIPTYTSLAPNFRGVKLNCADAYNQSYVYNDIDDEMTRISDLTSGVKVAAIALICPITFCILGGVSGFFGAVSIVNATLAIKNSNAYQQRLSREEKQKHIKKIMKSMPGLTPSEANGLTMMGMRVWLLQGPQLVQNKIIPAEIFLLISSFIAGNSIQEVENIRKAANKKLFIQIKQNNLNKYELKLFSKKEKENDARYKNTDGKARVRFEKRLSSLEYKRA